MNDALVHRGPDDEGYFIRGNAGLAMKRLSIIDLKGGHQPIYNETKSACVVCNGEIYNHREIRSKLEKKGHRFATQSDVEVIIHLYEDLEEGFVQELRGMFTVAIWDSNSNKLILARDRLGIKPLYYTPQNNTFLFASELKAILQHPGIEKELSFEALSDYLTFLYIPAPKTIFNDIFKLPPAHTLVLTNGNIEIKQYWELNYHKDKKYTQRYYAERLEELLTESIKMHLMSDVPLGAFLSGGMDSSTIVALMAKCTRGPVKTFSVGFDTADFNELQYAKIVAERFGTEHHEMNLKPDIINMLPRITGYFDEPFADSSAIPTYLISEFARRNVTVCLSGDGGDELFAGYGWTRRQKFINDYNRLPKIPRNFIKRLFLNKTYAPTQSGKMSDKLRRFLHDANLTLPDSFMRRKTCFSSKMQENLLKDEIYRKISGYNSASVILPYLMDSGIKNDIEKLLFADTKVYLPDDGLCKVDRMSMMNSLEVRVPFLDHKVVEFAASIPMEYKMRGRTSKYILKQVMRKYLPQEILKQRKLGFTIPLNSWFRGKLKGFAQETLLDQKTKLSRIFNHECLKKIINEHAQNRQNFGSQIYALLVLELWLDQNS
jgi:asparagine synthase (glutamine-hydrolysing)